jgi:membrane-bound acyltransferase YfiQ involved in biofilm formation
VKYVAQAAKAVVAFVLAGLGALGTALVNGHTLGDVTDAQWVVIVSIAIAAGYAVYQTPNTAAPTPTK